MSAGETRPLGETRTGPANGPQRGVRAGARDAATRLASRCGSLAREALAGRPDAVAALTRRAWLGAALALSLALPLNPAQAQDLPDPRLAEAARDSALAYVVTGDMAVDEASELGLRGLSDALTQRTTVEPGAPVAVTLDEDDLSLLTFLYWPVTADQPVPSTQAYARLNRFLRTGGVILFDTRDGDVAGTGAPDGSAALQRLAGPLDIPPLAPIPTDHVLTRAFYLLDDFPGRWQGTTLWVEASADPDAPAQGFRNANDGVSPVVIGGNSWAEAWAVDDAGQPAYVVGSGYDGENQREMALRFGINLVMYVLSGNYKSDQIHVPELLDRLGMERGELRPARPNQGTAEDALRDLLRVPGLLP